MHKRELPLGPQPTPTPTTPGYPPLSRQRITVLEYLRAHPPARITEIAAGLRLHPNTVREHLDALSRHRLVESTTETPTGRGRPAALYRPAVPTPDYAGLATALAGHLARTSAHPERDARAAGAEWGRELADESAATDDPRGAVLEVLDRLGYRPERDGRANSAGGVALRGCPILDAARRYPAIVCQVHLGIVEGILRQLGAVTSPGLDLIPFAEPGACRLFLPDPAGHTGADHD